MRHYSASQINMFIRCPAQWYFRYVMGLKQAPTSAMTQGTCFHDTLEANYIQKVQSKEDMPLGDVLDVYSKNFDTRIVDVEEKGVDTGALKDEGVKLVETYHTVKAPEIQPVSVETPITIEFDNVDYTVEGYVDLVDDKEVIHEHKTTKRTPSTVDQNYLFQGALYALSENKNKVVFDFAVKLKTPKIVSLEADISDKDKDFALTLIGQVDHAIRSEVFYPNRTSFMCSRKNCGYWNECEKKYGGKVKA